MRLVSYLLRCWRLRRDPVGYARSIGVQVGSDCRFIGVDAATFGSEPYLIRIGCHVTITKGVQFVTHDGGVWVFRQQHPTLELHAPIVVGNNVFIGINSIIMPGVCIGDNCVIGAGSVVTRNIPSGYVAVGSPARPIKTVSEYLEKAQRTGAYTRGLPPDKKREHLRQLFAADGPSQAGLLKHPYKSKPPMPIHR